jgi:hypothetical protein
MRVSRWTSASAAIAAAVGGALCRRALTSAGDPGPHGGSALADADRLTLLQDLRAAQVGKALAEDRLREYERAEREWVEENVRLTDVCAHNWHEINRLNSDIFRVTRARQAADAALAAAAGQELPVRTEEQ